MRAKLANGGLGRRLAQTPAQHRGVASRSVVVGPSKKPVKSVGSSCMSALCCEWAASKGSRWKISGDTVDYQIAVAFVLVAMLTFLFIVADASKYRKRSPNVRRHL